MFFEQALLSFLFFFFFQNLLFKINMIIFLSLFWGFSFKDFVTTVKKGIFETRTTYTPTTIGKKNPN